MRFLSFFSLIFFALLLPGVAVAQSVDTVREADRGVFRIVKIQEVSQGRYNIGTGTGYLINDDGYLVTNRHVVGNAETVFVLE